MKKPDYKTHPDYENLVNLLAILSEANARQTAMQGEIDQAFLDTIDAHRKDYAENQSKITETEEAIREIAARHPEWFPAKKKTVQTPYGSVKSVSSKKIVAPSPEASIALIKQADRATEFIRIREELDLEALEDLEDAELALFGIRREANETITPKPAVVNLGEAVKATEVPA